MQCVELARRNRNGDDVKNPDGQRTPIPDDVNAVATQIVDAAFRVHTALGPGLLESVYETCLHHECITCRFAVQRQKPIAIQYADLRLEEAFRIDLLVQNCVAVEVNAVEALLPVQIAQVLTYLKLTGCRLGLLINFNVPLVRDGIRRVVL